MQLDNRQVLRAQSPKTTKNKTNDKLFHTILDLLLKKFSNSKKNQGLIFFELLFNNLNIKQKSQ